MTIEEKINVMAAYANGQPIECRRIIGAGAPTVWFDCQVPGFNWQLYEYRVKCVVTPSIVPYESADEFVEAQKKHGPHIYACGQYHLPVLIDDRCVVTNCISGSNAHTYQELHDIYCWEDKTVCGKIVSK